MQKEEKSLILVISGIGFNEQSDARIYSSKTSKTKSFVSGFRGSKSIDRTERAKGWLMVYFDSDSVGRSTWASCLT